MGLMCVLVEDFEEDVDEVAEQVYNKHASLLKRGFALASTPTISQALEGVLPFRYVVF